MTETRRITISIPADIEAKLIELRKTDEFCRMSWAELIRTMIERGLNQ
ncbi:MAG: hypothetical protein LUC48_09750 [Clostridiales bacterium]|nr:hypothetical protein [Clostridiales bacterium]